MIKQERVTFNEDFSIMTIVTSNEDGLKLEINFNINGQAHGEYRGWYDNGQLALQITYINGQAQGLGRKWYDNGQLGIETTYRDGLENGVRRMWYDNGELLCEETYKDGETLVKKKYKPYWFSK